DKGQGSAVGRQSGLIFESRIVRQSLQPRTVRMYAPDIGRPSAVGCKHDPVAVGGNRCVIVERGIRHQGANVSAVLVGEKDIAVIWREALESDGVLRSHWSSFGLQVLPSSGSRCLPR